MLKKLNFHINNLQSKNCNCRHRAGVSVLKDQTHQIQKGNISFIDIIISNFSADPDTWSQLGELSRAEVHFKVIKSEFMISSPVSLALVSVQLNNVSLTNS